MRKSRLPVGDKASQIDFLQPPNASAIVYSGPIPQRTAENGIVAILRENATFASGSGTSFISILDNNPSGADNWSEYSNAWGEYRVLAMRVEYEPIQVVNTAAVTAAPLVHSVVHQPGLVSSPTNYGQAFSIGDAKLGNTMRKYVRLWRMSGSSEAVYQSTLAPAATGLSVLSSAFGLTTATTYGYAFITYLVQFRTSSV
jgi:hypothetical protein